jgi:hypothetical protein
MSNWNKNNGCLIRFAADNLNLHKFFFAGWNHNINFACKGLDNYQILKRVVYRGLNFFTGKLKESANDS